MKNIVLATDLLRISIYELKKLNKQYFNDSHVGLNTIIYDLKMMLKSESE